MRKTHNLSSHHHPWEIQFVAVPLAPVHTKRVTATWHSLEHGIKPVLMSVACVSFFFGLFCVLSCVVCHGSLIFLLIRGVIQCASKQKCSLKERCMYTVLCACRDLNEEWKQMQELGSTVRVQRVHCSLCCYLLSDFIQDVCGCLQKTDMRTNRHVDVQSSST